MCGGLKQINYKKLHYAQTYTILLCSVKAKENKQEKHNYSALLKTALIGDNCKNNTKKTKL